MAIWHKQVWSPIESAVDNADVVALHRLWRGLSPAPGQLPALSDLALDGPLSPFAARMTVYRPLPDGDYLGHFCGDEFRHDSLSDPTGLCLSQQAPELADFQRSHFDEVAARCLPLYMVHFAHSNPWVLTWERLVMPARGDDGQPWILVFNQPMEARAKLLETVLNCASEGLLALRRVRSAEPDSTHWLVTVANLPFVTLAGQTDEPAQGRLAHEVFPNWARLDLDADCLAVVQTRTPRERELELPQDGASRWFNVHIGPLLDGCMVRLTDVTAIKDKEQALQDNARRLQADNEQLRQLAWRDGLTGLLNRRALDVILDREVARSLRLSEPLALVMCDIDHFKAFNDFYGHLIGDDCLREVGQVLSGVIQRATDMVARYGGEEFTLVLPNTVLNGGLDLVQRIQHALHERGLPDATSPEGKLLTLSFGVAEFDPRRDATAHTFLERADSALYRAKHQGRNRVGLAYPQGIQVLESQLSPAG